MYTQQVSSENLQHPGAKFVIHSMKEKDLLQIWSYWYILLSSTSFIFDKETISLWGLNFEFTTDDKSKSSAIKKAVFIVRMGISSHCLCLDLGYQDGWKTIGNRPLKLWNGWDVWLQRLHKPPILAAIYFLLWHLNELHLPSIRHCVS